MSKKRPFLNRLNNLSPKEWLKFQKSWFIHNPPPRRKSVLRHPAKFPETLMQEFVEFFTKSRQTVLDPMVGTGSTLIACLRSGRHAIGIELNPTYADIARDLVKEEQATLGKTAADLNIEVITGDAAHITDYNLPVIDYVLTSPPYWNMLHARGAETQRKRTSSQNLDVIYSDDPADVGNIPDYDEFLNRLVAIYAALRPLLRPRAYLTIIVKNVKKGGRIYPLAWDLARSLGKVYTLKDEKIWCQDDIRLAPYGLGSAWVSNTFHHYCLQFRHEPETT
jgi:DNA modification methylase